MNISLRFWQEPLEVKPTLLWECVSNLRNTQRTPRSCLSRDY